jgi:hypothetical protein
VCDAASWDRACPPAPTAACRPRWRAAEPSLPSFWSCFAAQRAGSHEPIERSRLGERRAQAMSSPLSPMSMLGSDASS